MNGRMLSILLVLIIGLVCLVSSPVTSGEHPWDADSEGERGGGDDEGDGQPIPDTVIVDSVTGDRDDGSGSSPGEGQPTDQQSTSLMQMAINFVLGTMLGF